jgi:hypothetical protein
VFSLLFVFGRTRVIAIVRLRRVVMSRQSSAQGAIALLAKGLVQLAAAVRAVDALERGPHRVRAALAVLRAHAELGAALGVEHAPAWTVQGRAPLERALALMSGEEHVLDARAALLEAATSCERRVELLVRGLRLRGRAAVLHRVSVELATRPAEALDWAERAPQPWTAEATRLAKTGVARLGKLELFVPAADHSSADRFPPSRAFAAACARAGAYDALSRIMRALPSHDGVLEVIALFAAEDRKSALGRLAQLSARDRDRALLALVSLEIEKRGAVFAESLARKIRGSKRRASAFAAIVHAQAIGLAVRRDLLNELQDVHPLEQALLMAEIAVARQSPYAVSRALEHAAKLLCQKTPLETLDDTRPSPWERALRCGLALALSGHTPPRVLNFSRKSLLVMAESAFVRRELVSLVPLLPERLEQLVERLPTAYRRFASVLRGLAIEQRARHIRAAERVRALSEHDLESLRRPSCRDEAIVAGALLESRAVELSSAASSPLRAAFDFGVALSPHGESRRRVLMNAAKVSLRSAQDADAADVVRLRVATLRQLEDSSVADLAGKLLVECNLPKTARLELLELVVRQRPAAAAGFVWSHFAKLTDHGRDAADVLNRLEQARALDAGAAQAWDKLRSACGAADACDWWTAFLVQWNESFRRSASKRLIDACSAALRAGDLPRDGRLAAERIAQGIARWRATGLCRLFARGTVRDLEWVVLACEPDPARSWPVQRWQKLVARLNRVGGVDTTVVARFVRELAAAPSFTTNALLSGSAPTPALQKPLDIGHGLELQYLDKPRELLSFLRIADCVGCCYSSAGPHYEGCMQTSQWILRLYRDPLSYGFHVRRADDGARMGFVFGGFGLVREPALLLNGVYLRRQQRTVRAAVLDGIEHALARPLGVEHIGVATRYGGEGELPSDYRFETRRGIRLRAIRDAHGALERTIYDDISDSVNEEIDLPLHYKELN